MRLTSSLKRRPTPRPWQVCLCLLLIALVVYNPFAALNGSSGRLSYENLARNRASIGSGELQHFSPVSDPDVLFDLNVDSRDAEPVIDVRETQLDRTQQEAIPSEPAPLAGFWFRPPPSL
jgi:hypothetical protein